MTKNDIDRVEFELGEWAEWISTPVPGLCLPTSSNIARMMELHCIVSSNQRFVPIYSGDKKMSKVNQAIGMLSKKSRVMITAHFQHKYSHDDIRKVLKQSLKYYDRQYNQTIKKVGRLIGFNIK